MRIQAFGYFGMQGIGNVNRVLPNPLTVSDLTKLDDSDATEIQKKSMIGCAQIW